MAGTSEAKVTATARVTLTIEIEIPSSWGESCDLAQVHKQASETAVGMLRDHHGKHLIGDGRGRIIGQPKVNAIITEWPR
jgi:hypothetical protein